ncbi:MAG: hypothetical protein RLZZ342_8 [Candidatus Parcubacteria bacterium]|jgi:hypothetical protein
MRRALFLAALSTIPLPVYAATPRTFADVANLMLVIIGQATLALMIAAVAIYFWSIAYNMLQLSKGEAAEWKSHFFWGVVVIFVMVSIWGIVQILQNTIFTSGGGSGTGGRGAPCVRFGDPGCGN